MVKSKSLSANGAMTVLISRGENEEGEGELKEGFFPSAAAAALPGLLEAGDAEESGGCISSQSISFLFFVCFLLRGCRVLQFPFLSFLVIPNKANSFAASTKRTELLKNSFLKEKKIEVKTNALFFDERRVVGDCTLLVPIPARRKRTSWDCGLIYFKDWCV